MRKTCGNMKKNKKKIDSSLAEMGPRNQRDYSVYSESKHNSFVEDRQVGKVGCRKTMVYSSENKYNWPGSFTPHHNNNKTYEI
jgi:hypothetical protein